jgi:hypothetical protein
MIAHSAPVSLQADLGQSDKQVADWRRTLGITRSEGEFFLRNFETPSAVIGIDLSEESHRARLVAAPAYTPPLND